MLAFLLFLVNQNKSYCRELLCSDWLFFPIKIVCWPNIEIFAEFQKIAVATAIGFAIMGFIGFFVKLIHIPINNIIVQ